MLQFIEHLPCVSNLSMLYGHLSPKGGRKLSPERQSQFSKVKGQAWGIGHGNQALTVPQPSVINAALPLVQRASLSLWCR